MKIAVLGAGAMGSMYGGHLSEKNEVWLVDVWKEHVEKIQASGLTIRIDDKDELYYPKAAVSAQEAGVSDLVIVFVKSVNTAEALQQSKELFGDHTMVLTLQNGYGNAEDILPYVKSENLFIGTASGGATVLGAGHVYQARIGVTKVGTLKGGDSSRAGIIAEVFNGSGVPTEISEDIMSAVWEKLIVNSGLNAPCSLLNVRIGFMSECRQALELGKRIVEEGVAVAKAEGYDVSAEHIVQDYYIDGAKGAGGHNRCSMLQDADKKRKTEVERINGAIAELGGKHGIPTPYNEAMLLMIGAMEKLYTWK